MHRFRYTIFAPVGPGKKAEKGTVADLLDEIDPYGMRLSRLVPPLPALNELLGRGVWDAGMSGGCRWEPFALDEAAYEELADALTSREAPLRRVDAPEWVRTWDDWHALRMEVAHGIPARRHRDLARRTDRLQAAARAAAEAGDEARSLELHAASIRAGEKVARFMDRHLPQGGGEPGE